MSVLDANAPWDRQWRVAIPDDYTPGLHRMHQLVAFDLLRSSAPLTNWEAVALQTMAYQVRDLSDLQRFWLRRIEDQCARWAA